MTLKTFLKHGNPVVQLDHLDLTACGPPLLEGHGSSQIDGIKSRSNYHQKITGQLAGFA